MRPKPNNSGRAATRSKQLYTIIGTRVRALRGEMALTQGDLAAAAGTSRTTITNLERGKQQVPAHVLLAIADRLEVDLPDLIPVREELSTASEDGGLVTVPNARPLPPRAARVLSAHASRSADPTSY